MNQIFLRVIGFLNKVFGNFHYSPPAWAKKAAALLGESKAGQKYGQLLEWKSQNPQLFRKRAAGMALGLLILAAGGIGFKKYWDSRPLPDYVTLTSVAPLPTDPETKNPQPLEIRFSKSVVRPEQLSKPVTEGITMDPSVAGTWSWRTDRSLVFVPDLTKGDWGVGEKYKVEFKKALFASHLIFDSYDVEFSTQAVRIQAMKREFYIDPKNAETKKVLVNFKSNYPLNIEDFKKRVDFELENKGVVATSKKVPFSLTTNKFLTEVYLQSESLPIPRDSQTMVVKVEKGVKAQAGGQGSQEEQKISVAIPSLYEGFSISSANLAFARNEKYEPEQIIIITTKIEAKSEDVAAKLKVFLLPADREASGGQPKAKNYPWQSVAEITPELQRGLSEVPFKLVPSEQEWSKIHTFKIQVEPRRYLHLALEGGLKAIGGYELKNKYEQVLRVNEYPQELSIMSQGSILTLSGDLKLPLLARNVGEVEFTLYRIIPDQVNHLLYQMTGNVASPYLPYGLESQIAEKFEDHQTLKIESAKATQYFSFDLQPFLNKAQVQKGIFLFEVRAKNRNGSFGATDKRLVMVTDLGVLVKETVSKSNEVFVQNFRTGRPVEGATVEVVGTNGLTVLKAQTDAVGRVTFPDLKNFQNEKRPIAFAVRREQDQAFLPFRNETRNLQYSRFDIGGLYENSQSDQLMSMIFSDRGIYRPGELAHLGLIVRSKKGQASGTKPPLEWTVTDPKGSEILREKLNMGSGDLRDLEFKTDENAPTGIYTIQVYLLKRENPRRVELLGTQTVRVEEFQPDRMKMTSHLQDEKTIGWLKPQELHAFISLKNMFGTPAENRLVKADLTLSPTVPLFKEFKDYTFTNLNPKDEQIFTENLGEQKTNDKGEAEFVLNLTKYQASLFSLRLNVEGFESEGGRSVRASSGMLVSPLNFILGAKADGDLYYIAKGAERSLHIIAVNPDVKLTAADQLTVALVERKHVSVLTQAEDGSYKYQSVIKENPLSEKKFSVGAKGSALKLETATPGDYTLIFRNAQKLDVLKVNYTIVGESNLAKALDRNAELQLSLNKADFKNGEDIQMQIKAPYTGSGLITIERDGVYASKWFKASSTTTVESIKVPDGIDGNAYVNVTFLRSIDSNEIYASPLSYAVAPFSISLDEHKTQLKVTAPNLVKPGQTLKIQYSANKKTQIILYGVDEGILQVARYKMPDPLSYFFQKRALQVKTYQMLDLLLPEFSLLQQMQAAGGDAGFGAIGKNINPFKSKRIKPVVFWSGVIQADTTTKTFTFEVPDSFNGNMKIMAISAGKEGLGSVQTDALVRGDLIISPNVPMFVAPQDEFIVGVSVSNQAQGSGAKSSVNLETSSSGHFNVVEGKTLQIPIPEGHEESREIKLKTLDQLGVGQLTFKASLGQAKAQIKLEVSVRPSTPYLHFLQTGLFSGAEREIKNPRKVYGEYSDIKMQASASPFIMASGLVSYLETYPYLCTEQLISRAVPTLVLRSMKEYLGDDKKLKETFQKTLQILRTRQHSDGGFALYSPLYEAHSNIPASLYAAHFLIEAKAKGLAVPEDILARAKYFLESSTVRVSGGNLTSVRRWAYSLYLSARLGVVNGASLAQLRRELEKDFKNQWEKDVTALFMAGTYSLYRQEELGEKLIASFQLGDSAATDYEDYLDPLARDAILLYFAGKHYPSHLKNLVNEKSLENLMKPINQGFYQTHSIGWLLMAFDAMSQNEGAQAALASLKLSISKGQDFVSLEAHQQKPKTWKLATDVTSTKLSGGGGLLFYAFKASGFDKVITPVKKNLEVSRQYRDKNDREVKSVKMGEEVTVHLQVRSLDQKVYPNVAIVDLIPSGFEMVAANRMETTAGNGGQGAEDPGGSAPATERDEGAPNEEEGEPQEEGGGALFRLLLPQAYAQTSTSLNALEVNFVDEREDRMILYATVTGDLTEYVYKIKAVNKGLFITPPTFAEGMYNRELQFLGNAASIEVTNQ